MGAWDDPNRLRLVFITLAIIGLVYLVAQPRSDALHISSWRNPGISGEAEIRAEAQQGGLNRDVLANTDTPIGNPLRDTRTVMTQGYGVGSHAPAETWGGVDLAIDGDGDGSADPQGTLDVPVYATHSGTAQVSLDTWPGGNCVLLRSTNYRTTYCHLNSVAIPDGAQVQRGQQIGAVGSTGNSNGPHLHYEVWEHEVNHNPLDYGALDNNP